MKRHYDFKEDECEEYGFLISSSDVRRVPNVSEEYIVSIFRVEM
jgi:hypothetical protein